MSGVAAWKPGPRRRSLPWQRERCRISSGGRSGQGLDWHPTGTTGVRGRPSRSRVLSPWPFNFARPAPIRASRLASWGSVQGWARTSSNSWKPRSRSRRSLACSRSPRSWACARSSNRSDRERPWASPKGSGGRAGELAGACASGNSAPRSPCSSGDGRRRRRARASTVSGVQSSWGGPRAPR